MSETLQPQHEATKEHENLEKIRARVLGIPVRVCRVVDGVPRLPDGEPTQEVLNEVYEQILARNDESKKLTEDEIEYIDTTVGAYLDQSEVSIISQKYLRDYNAVEEAYKTFQELIQCAGEDEASIVVQRNAEKEIRVLQSLQKWMEKNSIIAPNMLKKHLRERLSIVQLADKEGRIPLAQFELFKDMVTKEPTIVVYE